MHHGQTRREDKKSKIGKNILHFHSRQYKRPTKLAHCNAYRQLQEYILQHRYISLHRHRRRLVINIGGAKIWVTNIGGTKILGKFIFRQKILKKFPSILLKISDDLFLVIDSFFTKFTPFIQNVLRFLCIVVSVSFIQNVLRFLCIVVFVSAFFHVYFFSINKIKKISSDYWGGQKGVLPPHPNFWGGGARAAPQSLRLCP